MLFADALHDISRQSVFDLWGEDEVVDKVQTISVEDLVEAGYLLAEKLLLLD